MAVYRPTPKCPYCGAVIAEAVHSKSGPHFIGDTFLRWDYIKHSCEGQEKADKEMEEVLNKLLDEKRKKGTLPPFMKP